MKKITRKSVFAEYNKKKPGSEEKMPRRICFRYTSGLREEEGKVEFSIPVESAKKVFESQTGLKLEHNSHGDYVRCVAGEEEIATIQSWEKEQGRLFYLRDCLSLSIALNVNFVIVTDTEYSPFRCTSDNTRVREAGFKWGSSLRDAFADKAADKIRNLPFYRDADMICSMPALQREGVDVPASIVLRLGKRVHKRIMIQGFLFGGERPSDENTTCPTVRDGEFEEEWSAWSKSGVSIKVGDKFDVRGKKIILVDAYYKTGVPMQYIAMLLQKAGAREVYGLSLLKTFISSEDMHEITEVLDGKF